MALSPAESPAEDRVPDRMKAAVIDRFGRPEEVMHTATIAVPRLGDDEVLIRVGTAGVGAWDPSQCDGSFADGDQGFPRVLGSDGAGTVVAAGPQVRRFHLRDRVYAWGFLNPKGGFFAEYAAVPEEEVSSVPPTLSLAQAGTLAVDGLTALAGLDRLETGADQSLMILGASGGIGHIALQLAKRLGARVLAVASGDDGVQLVHWIGADAAVDGHRADLAAAVHAFAPEGLDAALVLTGGAPDAALALVRRGGRVAYPNGVEPRPDPGPGVAVEAFDGYSGREALDRLNGLVAMAPFHVEVSREYLLDEASTALRDVSRHHLGKLALRIGRG